MNTTYNSMNNSDLPQGCGCNACANVGNGVLSDNRGVDNGNSDVYAPTIEATKDEFSDYLINGFWNDFGGGSRQWNTAIDNSISFTVSNGYTAEQQAGFRVAFESWSDVANITFTEVTTSADISVNTNNESRAYSTSSVYSGSGNIAANVISIDNDQWYWKNFDELGDYALTTAIHEIGHSLGLGHVGNYNGSASYANDANFVNDSRQFSVMSYFNASETGAHHQGEYASTPLLFDIYAIQQMYGANMDIRNGDTVYGFNSTADRDQYDFTVNVKPVVSIWDGDGVDTIDVSGWSMNQTVNLNDGEFSNVGGGVGNLSIAFDALIENAITGNGADTLHGNAGDNILTGNAGNDAFYASIGNDTINGGADSDTITYELDFSNFNISPIGATTVVIQHIVDGYSDTINNVENYVFNGQAYTHSQLVELSTLETVNLITSGGTGTWTKKLYHDAAGVNGYTGENLISSNSTDDWIAATYSGSNLSLSRTTALGNNVDYMRVTDSNLTALSLDRFKTSVVKLYNNDDIDVNVSGAVTGYIGTAAGHDTITVDLISQPKSGETFDIYSKGGHDTITVDSISHRVRLYAGRGDDTVTIAHGNNHRIYLDDGDDILRLESTYSASEIQAGNGNDTIYLNTQHNDKIYGGAGNDTITVNGGTGRYIVYAQDGDDTITGGIGNEKFYGGAGNDTIMADAGHDVLYGDDGNDNLYGGGGNDWISAGSGLDNIYAGIGNDKVYAGDGDDYVEGDSGIDEIHGQGGNDEIHGGISTDYIFGGDDDDLIFGDGGNDRLYGQNGIDIIRAGDGDDRVYGGAGDDTLYGEEGRDIIVGDRGNDTIHGGAGIDTIYGKNDNDTIYGDDGSDNLDGGYGDDAIYGGTGNDGIVGRQGNDILFGETGNDTIYGGDGIDRIYGGLGADKLYGEKGDDILFMNGELDLAYGGEGSDMFVMTDLISYDRIADFNIGEGDVLNLTDILTGYDAALHSISDFVVIDDKGGSTNVNISANGDGNFNRAVQVYGNALDGFNAEDLLNNGVLVANQPIS